ncbi:hypothetical protein ACINB_14040 [Acidovorax sp. NB1]|nr:hypothetical protein ACINB_14040 [Acidovorax sp. NB1]
MWCTADTPISPALRTYSAVANTSAALHCGQRKQHGHTPSARATRQPKVAAYPPHWRVAGHTAKLPRMKMHKILLLAVACTWAMGAAAQWQWIDKDGRKVFSDRPPPADVQEKNILKQPGGALPARPAPAPAAAATGDAPATAAAPAAAPAPKLAASAAGSGKDKELEEKKAQAEAAEAAKKKAEDEKIAKTKAENCTRARAAKAAFDAGKPITQTNAQGERIFLDGTARAAEAKRIDGIVASDCAR